MVQMRKRPLKIGIFLPFAEGAISGTTPRWDDIKHMALCAEEAGFDSLWLGDHLLFRFNQPIKWLGGISRAGAWECWSLLAALAAVTSRIELGSLVTCTSFRNPTLLAKMADTVDEISNGRLILGLGAGYHEPEYHAFGYPYDNRISRFAEAVTIIHSLLRHGQVDFMGSYYTARDCELRPRSLRRTGPPILIGGEGERILNLAARYADLWNGWLAGRDVLAETPALQTRVDAICQLNGREPTTLTRTIGLSVNIMGRKDYPPWLAPLDGSPELIADALRSLALVGVGHVQVTLNPSTPAAVEAFATVLNILDRDIMDPGI